VSTQRGRGESKVDGGCDRLSISFLKCKTSTILPKTLHIKTRSRLLKGDRRAIHDVHNKRGKKSGENV